MVECATAKLTVHVEPASESAADGIDVGLGEYDPVWFNGGSVAGRSVERQNREDPFVFEQVPPGRYVLTCYRASQFGIRQVIEITSGREQTASLELPRGSATLSGKLAPAICDPKNHAYLRILSKDQRLHGTIIPKDDGTYLLEHIPAGDYLISDKDVTDIEPLLTISLRDGEHKTLDITPENVSPQSKTTGMLALRIFTLDGVPMAGADVRFTDSEHPPTLRMSRGGRFVFVGRPGIYGASISFPGFKPVRRTLELKPVARDGIVVGNSEVHVLLQPDKG